MSPSDSSAKAPLSPALAAKLLDLLATDDDFRQQFAADPHAALVALGATDAQAAVGCLAIDQLATPAQFAAARDVLLNHLTEVAAFNNPFCFVDAKA